MKVSAGGKIGQLTNGKTDNTLLCILTDHEVRRVLSFGMRKQNQLKKAACAIQRRVGKSYIQNAVLFLEWITCDSR